MGKKPLTPPLDFTGPSVEPEKVTAPVTAPTEDPWAHLEIPPFLRRVEGSKTPTAPSTPASMPSTPRSATAPAAAASAGATSGVNTGATMLAGVTGCMFNQFRVDPEEIESKIRHEADRRWRAWVPTKEHLSRPRKSYYLKQVRKEFYP